MSETGTTVAQVLLSLNLGGAEVLADRIARRLSDRFRFVFVCLGETGDLSHRLLDDGFTVLSVGRREGIDLRAGRRLASAFRRERVGVVHAHQYAPFLYSALGRLTSRPLPIVMTEHGRHHPDLPSRKRSLVNRLLLRPRDRLAAVGEAVRRALIDNEGFPAGRVEVVYNGVNLAAFAGAGRDRAAVRRELGLGELDFVVVQVARLQRLKDHLTAVRAFERVVRERPDARLVLVGGGAEAGEIARAVRDRGLEPFVRTPGVRGDVPRLLGAADLGLLTSISEGIPLSLIEAMAAGLAVVATRVGGVPEVVLDGETGLLSPAGDDDGLAGQVLRLAGDPALRARMGRAGLDRAHAAFSEDRMVGEYDAIYRQLAAGSGRPRPVGAAAGSG